MTSLSIHSPGSSAIIDQAGEKTRAYVRASRAENTRRAYAADWRNFTAWTSSAGLEALPAAPETVGLYPAAEAGRLRPGTLARHLVAITAAHRAAGHQLDTRALAIRETLTGIKRTHGTSQNGKAPTVVADLKAMLESQRDTLAGLRNRALLLLGFAGALRRSELASLDVEDLDFTSAGLVVTVRRSKTDQEGESRKVGVPFGRHLETCPVRILKTWLDTAHISTGPLFREINRGDRLNAPYADKQGRQRGLRLGDKAVALVVKRAAEAAGLDPTKYAGHSLRSGLATSAAAAGASERSIMAATGHRSVQMVRRYIRTGELFKDNAAAAIGL